MTLTLRVPKALDFFAVYTLAAQQAPHFLDDFHDITPRYLERILSDPASRIIEQKAHPVGVVWYDPVLADLHAEIHFLLQPCCWKQALREGLPAQIVSDVFSRLGVDKLLAYPMHTQTTALTLLRRTGFYEHNPWRNHTRQHGRKVDVIFFELKKNYWKKISDKQAYNV